MQSNVDDGPSGPASGQVIALELAQEDSTSVDVNLLSRIPELLQSKGLTSTSGSGSSAKIILGKLPRTKCAEQGAETNLSDATVSLRHVGNMGYPNLEAILEGKRGFLEGYEKTLVRSFFHSSYICQSLLSGMVDGTCVLSKRVLAIFGLSIALAFREGGYSVSRGLKWLAQRRRRVQSGQESRFRFLCACSGRIWRRPHNLGFRLA